MPRSCTPTLAAAAAALLLATAAPAALAQASAPAPAATAATATTAAPSMGFQQVVDRVSALGYTDVREVERKGDKLFEVKARNPQGRRAELLVDARSGEVLRTEVK